MDGFFYNVMIGGENFVSVFRQVFQLSMVSDLNYTKEDIENMPPYERYVYFDLVEEYNEEITKTREKQNTSEIEQQYG